MYIRFLKGVDQSYPQVKDPISPWDLNLVLTKLMPPFESLATCSLLHLLRKVAFMMAITSARRVGEL